MNPVKTAQIFNHLRSGKFLNDNSRGPQKSLFRFILENKEKFIKMYKNFGLELKVCEKYAYIAQIGDYKQKVENISKFLTILNFFIIYDRSFGPGTRMRISEIELKTLGSDNLKELLPAKNTSVREQIESYFKKLEKHSFLECLDEDEGEWLVLDSIMYLVNIFENVNTLEVNDAD